MWGSTPRCSQPSILLLRPQHIPHMDGFGEGGLQPHIHAWAGAWHSNKPTSLGWLIITNGIRMETGCFRSLRLHLLLLQSPHTRELRGAAMGTGIPQHPQWGPDPIGAWGPQPGSWTPRCGVGQGCRAGSAPLAWRRCYMCAVLAPGSATRVPCHPQCPSCVVAQCGRAVTGEAAGRADELIDTN